MSEKSEEKGPSLDVELSNDDIYEAMKEISGYLDITPEDLKDVYRHAFHHAVERIVHSIRARDIMTREVVSVKSETPLVEVAEKMAQKRISGVPIIEESTKVAGLYLKRTFSSAWVQKI